MLTARARNILRSWRKEEILLRRQGSGTLRLLAIGLLALTPCLALHGLVRGKALLAEQQAQQSDMVALMETTLQAEKQNVLDWAQWDDTQAFIAGRMPDYERTNLDSAALFNDGTLMFIVGRDGSTRLVHPSGASQPSPGGSLLNCARTSIVNLRTLEAPIRLACTTAGGDLYLGAAALISDSARQAPATAAMALLVPLSRPQFTARIRDRLQELQANLVAIGPDAIGRRSGGAGPIPLSPTIHSGGQRQLALRTPGLGSAIARTAASELPIWLAAGSVAIGLRLWAILLGRRRRRDQRRVELQAARQIRRTCRQLDGLMAELLPAQDLEAPSTRHVLGRLATSQDAGVERAASSSDELPRVARRFEEFLNRASDLALFDTLTQLPNRRYFLEQVRASAHGRSDNTCRFALLFIDIDKFKVINDTYGHAVGDEVLVTVSQRLQAQLTPVDFMARYGGDELAIIMDLAEAKAPSTAALSQRARERAQAMIGAMAEPVTTDHGEIAVSLSIGISLIHPDDGNIQAVIQRSDLAMYQAKRNRHRRVVGPDDVIDIPQLSNYQLFTDLIETIRCRELQVFFQPIYGADGHQNGVEALARWHHPEQGWIEPGTFLAMAEQHRQMQILGQELMRISLDGFQQLRRHHPALLLYLNIAPSQLLDPGLAEQLLSQIDQHGLTGGDVVVELTEHSVLEPNACINANLHTLRQAGIRLALDDFGTGYSSLVLLKTIHPDVIKIDKSFTQSIENDNEAVHIIAMIAELAPRLGVELIGEGIEDIATLQRLQHLGVGLFQGFELGPPAPLQDWMAAAKQGLAPGSTAARPTPAQEPERR